MSAGADIDLATAPSVSDARLASVLNTAADSIIIFDGTGAILVVNPASERLFGYKPDEIIGSDISTLMPADVSERLEEADGPSASAVRRLVGATREIRGRHKDGTTFPIELSVSEAATPRGRQFVGILRDLRARKDAEGRLNQLQSDLMHMARVSAMDEMGAALAHELNQPLTAILLYLQAAQRSGASDGLSERTNGIIAKAIREAERAGSIIQRMRSFVEKRDPQRKVLDLKPLVDEAVELTLLGHGSQVRVDRVFNDGVPAISVDPVQIQQVIVNLVRNALDAVRNAAVQEIKVSIRVEQEFVLVQVTDSGPGVPRQMVPNLFQAFSTSKRKGLGLGLAISKTIAQNHGGDLWVDPGGDGRGATFTLQLPAPGDTV
jgi:two-component system sensor kinase FixL